MKKTVLNKIKPFLLYLLLWVIVVLAFWVLKDNVFDYYKLHSLLGYWIVFPLLIFFISLCSGYKNWFGKFKWLLCIGFGLMHMMMDYLTMALSYNIEHHSVIAPEIIFFVVGFVSSLVGLVLGYAFYMIVTRKKLKTMGSAF